MIPDGMELQQRRIGRLALIGAAALCAYVVLASRAAYVQVLQPKFGVIHDRQYVEDGSLSGLRGDIVDRNGRLLATSALRPSVVVDVEKLPRGERSRTARQLARLLGQQPTTLSRKLASARRSVKVARGIADAQADAIKRAKLPHVEVKEERLRVYPSWEMQDRALAASYIGYTNIDGKGRGGIEARFDSVLRGSEIERTYFVDGKRNKMVTSRVSIDERMGAEIKLALDVELQLAAEQALERVMARHSPVAATLLALDPYTGDVLVVAETPCFDPNRYWLANPDLFRARLFQWTFEPGSVIKPFVIALGIEAGVIHPREQLEVDGETLSIGDVLRKSSNGGTTQIAQRLGPERLSAGLRRFGFGSVTGSNFPAEQAGRVPNHRPEQRVELANLSFGQGMSATAIQLAVATAALANGGKRVTPRLVLSVDDEEVPVAAESDPIVSRATAETVRAMLREVVTNGTGQGAALEHYAAAGKTGTAQKVVGQAYSDEQYVAGFVGMVPEREPRIVVVVAIDEPRGNVHSGGAVAAPVFREFSEAAMRVLGVPPEGAL